MPSLDTPPNGLLKLIVPATVLAVMLFGVFVVVDQLEQSQRSAEQRALSQRSELLTATTLTPGSALACLDSIAGEAAEAACEARVFASPQSTAAAVAYIGARLALLADAGRLDPAFGQTFATARRSIERDRYGIAAQVLAVRDGCSASDCPAFALFGDANTLKANMKAQVFDQYVSRHESAWTTPVRATPPPAVSQVPSAPQTAAVAPKTGEPVAHPLSDKYDFPSAASIPPVSIMNSEPALPKAATEAQAAQPEFGPDAAPKAETQSAVPVPAKRPQAQRQQADPAPAR